MSRNFSGATSEQIEIGDIAGVDFDDLTAWTFLVFFRVEDTTLDNRCIFAKWGTTTDRIFKVETDTETAPASLEVHMNTTVETRTGNIIAEDTWYCFAASNNGGGGAGDLFYYVYDMSLTEILASSRTHPGDPGTTAAVCEIGIDDFNGSPTNPFDGDIAHVCYLDRGLSSQEVQGYVLDPYGSVQTWKAAGDTVFFYLPLIGESPEPDFSGSGNNGTINGTPAIGANPPTATFPADIPIIFPAGVTSAGLDTEQKRRAAIAISHYAMAPSPTTDGAFSGTDRAVIGYGYFDASTGQVVVSRSASDGVFVFDLLAQKKELHVQREGVFAPDRAQLVRVHVQQEGVLLDEDSRSFAIRFREVSDSVFTPDQIRSIEEHVQSEGILILERRSSIVEALQREGLLLDESSIGLRVFSRTVTEGLFLFDRQIHERAMVALDRLVFLETLARVQEHTQREGLFLDDSSTPVYLPGFNVISRSVSDGLLLSEMIYRIEEHIQSEGLLVLDQADPFREVSRAVSDGLLLIDRFVRAEEHLAREGIVLDENLRRVIEIVQSEGLLLDEEVTRTVIEAVLKALVWAKAEAVDPLGMVASAQPDVLGMVTGTLEPLGMTPSFVRNWE